MNANHLICSNSPLKRSRFNLEDCTASAKSSCEVVDQSFLPDLINSNCSQEFRNSRIGQKKLLTGGGQTQCSSANYQQIEGLVQFYTSQSYLRSGGRCGIISLFSYGSHITSITVGWPCLAALLSWSFFYLGSDSRYPIFTQFGSLSHCKVKFKLLETLRICDN